MVFYNFQLSSSILVWQYRGLSLKAVSDHWLRVIMQLSSLFFFFLPRCPLLQRVVTFLIQINILISFVRLVQFLHRNQRLWLLQRHSIGRECQYYFSAEICIWRYEVQFLSYYLYAIANSFKFRFYSFCVDINIILYIYIYRWCSF